MSKSKLGFRLLQASYNTKLPSNMKDLRQEVTPDATTTYSPQPTHHNLLTTTYSPQPTVNHKYRL